jgi:hypothetical protein
MALDFTNATLLGYNVQNEFLGENYNHRKVVSLSIECFIDEGKKAGNLDGVSENFQKIRELIAGGDDYWDSNISINGKNFGRGRVISLSFPTSSDAQENNIRLSKYTAELEVYRVGDIDQISDTTPPAIQMFAQYIQSWTENLDLSKQSDGSINANQTCSIELISGDYLATKDNPINIAKSMAALGFGNDQSLDDSNFLIDNYDKTILLGGIGQNYTEEYDLVNYSFKFSKKWTSLPEGNVPNTASNNPSTSDYDYMSKTSRSIESSDGVITVSERGSVESIAGDWFDMTGGMESAISSSYSRCHRQFLDTTYQSQQTTAGHFPLNTTPASISREYDSGAGVGSYRISFNNKSGISAHWTHEYQQSISRDAAGICSISERGSLRSVATKSGNWAATTFPTYTALAETSTKMTDSAGHAKEFYDNSKARLGETAGTLNETSSNITFPKYGKSISYNKEYSDDPNIYPDSHESMLKSASVSVSDSAPIPMSQPYMIPHRGENGEVIHQPGQTEAGTRGINIDGQIERPCGYSSLTGKNDSSNALINYWTPLTFLRDKVLLPEAYVAPSQLIGIQDMYIKDVSYSISSEGRVSLSANLEYTAARINPEGAWTDNNSNYNV